MKFPNELMFIVSLIASLASNQLLKAQIVPDNTLGNESSTIKSDVIIKENISDLIEGGAIRDANLFHSFLEFNIREGQRVFFDNPNGVINILTRITGNNISEIFGTLGVNGNANLFLINPNGIIFGENASLDVNGSFLASTAESINFADGTRFSSKNTQTQPLLTISIPIGLGMGETPGSIVNRSFATDSSGEFEVGLQVQPWNTLALVGGEVFLEGGIITAESGRIEIGSVKGNSFVSLNSTEQGWILGYEGVENFHDINLDFAFLDTSGDIGGDIQIQGKNIIFTGDTVVISNNFGEENGKDISIFASESVEMSGDATEISTTTENIGNASNISIETGTLVIKDGAFLNTSTSSEGKTGKLTIDASESIDLIGTTSDGTLPSGLFSEVLEDAYGSGELITINTKRLVVRDGAEISANTNGFGNASSLNINSEELIQLASINSFILSQVSSDRAKGNGGDINLETKKLLVQDGAQISSTTFGIGKAGNININASELVEVVGSTPDDSFASALVTQTEGQGNGGELNIQTNRLVVREGGQIASSAFDRGSGGKVIINSFESILLNGVSPTATLLVGNSGVFATAEPGARGNAGILDITTGKLIIENGARIGVDNLGTGEGGTGTLKINQLIIRDGGLVGAGSLLGQGAVDNQRGTGGILTVNATESVAITGTGTIGDTPVNSSLFTRAEGTGDAGDLIINTPNLTVKDGGEITAQSVGTGKGGSITATTKEITLNNGFITASTASTQGGNITLNIDKNLQFVNSGEITASAGTAQAGGDGGNVEINSDFILAFPTDNIYQITAEAFEGDGGNIEIATNSIFGREFINISASSQFGLDGNIAIDTPDVDPVQGLINLPTDVIDPSQLISQRCLAGDGETEGQSSEFIVTGRGGLPPSPNESLKGDAIISPEWVAIDSLATENTENSRLKTKKESPTPKLPEIVQARGWIRGENGRLTLVAENPYTVSSSSSVNYPRCQ